MFAKHLPPSAGLPRVLALDAATAAELEGAGLAEITLAEAPARLPGGPFDAIAGRASPEQVPDLLRRLRPGGRLILAAESAAPEALLRALTAAGCIHCLVEPAAGPLILYRGERPPGRRSPERLQALAAAPGPASEPRFVYLLIRQQPNKPAWKLTPGQGLSWQAVTVLEPATGQPQLLAFTSLVRAVAFMQRAVLAGAFGGVNKVGKFAGTAAAQWRVPLLVNPDFDRVRGAPAGPPLSVDPQAAITGEE